MNRNPVLSHAWQSAALAGLGLIGALVLFYLLFVRPFSAGFDLVSVRDGTGVAAGTLINAAGQPLENQLQDLQGLVLSGAQAGSLATVRSLEQVAGESRPILFGLEVAGRENEALIVGLGRPGAEDQTYVVEEGIDAQLPEQSLSADGLRFDEAAETLETQGPTFLNDQGSRLNADQGIRAEAGGTLEIR